MDGTWDLSGLYASLDDSAFLSDADAAETRVAEATAALDAPFLEDGGDWPARALAALDALERATEAYSRVSTYVSMRSLADSADEEAALYKQRFIRLKAELDIASDRLCEKLLDLKAPGRLRDDPRATRYAFYFAWLEKERAHALPGEINRCVHLLQTTGGRAWSKLRSDTETRAAAELELRGEVRSLPLSAVRALQSDADAEVRRRAFKAEIEASQRIAGISAACLNAIKGEAITVSELRRFASPLEWMLHVNKMTRATLEAMHAAIEERLPVFARYISAKAKLLGYDKGLPYYELNTPVGRGGKRYTLDEAKEYLAFALGRADAELGAFARAAFEKDWIDAYPRLGKYSGGICVPVPSLGESRVMVNFNGSFGDVVTIAHELGHAFHDFCTRHVPLFLRDAPTPVCETASTYNEILAYDAAPEIAGPGEKLAVLDAELTGATRNIVDIYSRFLFEDAAFERRAKETLTPESLCALMEKCQKKAYCGALDPDALHPYMWVAKPHYYIANFHYYNFPYAFGLLFSEGLFALRKAEPEGFMERYRKLLAATCEDTLEGIAARAGIDITSRDFWKSALGVFEEKIALFEETAKEVVK